MSEPTHDPNADPIEVRPVVEISQIFPARPASIPDIRDFVGRCLADVPMAEEGNGEVGRTALRALLDAAGPTGSIPVAFRVVAEHAEVDVPDPVLPLRGPIRPKPAADAVSQTPVRAGPGAEANGESSPATFAEWMIDALRREDMTQETAAGKLGVSIKTVSRWVRGTTQPRMRDLRRIKEVFGEVPIH